MDNNLRPIAYKYNDENIEQYFKDLDHWYRYFGRPKDWKIRDQKH